MKLIDIFKLGIEAGIKADPRKDRVKEVLEENKKLYEKEENKEYFNESLIWNPYNDSNILYGDENLDIKNIAVGIDMEAQELLIVDRLREKGEKIDLVLAHHPEGKSLFGLNKMIKIQEDLLLEAGVGVSTAEKILNESLVKYGRSLMSLNYNRAIDTAKILDIPFMNIHTAADNAVHTYLDELFKNKMPYKLKDIIKILLEEEEYKIASRNQNAPKIISGTEDNRVGKIYIDVTGGVEANDSIYEKMENAGVGTLIGMHMSEAHLKKAEEHNINVIMAGHMSSDTLGVNLILDAIEKVQKFDKVIDMSGFTRIRRI
ncbi:hypothetical protein [Haliovirga abyssi]|uniref:NGG1p interacting factor NIF3 n=1 Tax=Haliovirga abyssi TaxID=2996794 RepID=A0AAU9DF70_9FUSO|nr:hypothetical protein [Haliovirga abyssi]BDU51062.1 hypothetical protein HLVA_16310 [Haliovirga abyssi]